MQPGVIVISNTDSGDREGVPAVKYSNRFIVGLVDLHDAQVSRLMAVLTMSAGAWRWLMGRPASIDALFTSAGQKARESIADELETKCARDPVIDDPVWETARYQVAFSRRRCRPLSTVVHTSHRLNNTWSLCSTEFDRVRYARQVRSRKARQSR